MDVKAPAAGTGGRGSATATALGSLAVTLALAGAKLAVGVVAGSIALVSDGVQSSLDVGATAVTVFAVTVARKPPDREHPFGHGRAENLAALAEAVLMGAAGVWLALEAVGRLRTGAELEAPWYALALIAVAMVVDVLRVRTLRRASERHASPALAADAMNFTGDVLGSAAVFVGLSLTRVGLPLGDPVAALVVVGLMWWMAVRVGVQAIDVLMDRAPAGDLGERLTSTARDVDGVVGVEGIRVRRSGPHAHAELVVSVGRTHSVERSHEIARSVQDAIEHAIPGTHAVVRVAPTQAGEDVVGKTFAAANRVGLADQIHNVQAVSHPEGLWIMLHAKVEGDMPLGRAHEVTDILELELRREIEGVARVEIHLEPREPRRVEGRVVSAERQEVVREVTAIAESRPPITRCHEVAITETRDGLHLVLHCEAPAHEPIGAIHDASLGVEDEIHRRFEEVRSITVHFEPSAG